jgi:integrase
MKIKSGSIYSRGRVWWIKYYSRGRCFRESSHSASADDAERLLKRRQGEIVTGRFAAGIDRIRMNELFDDLLEDYQLNGRRSLVQLQSRLKNLRPAFGQIRAAEFSTSHIKRYIAKRAAKAHSTINRELEVVQRALTLASQSDPPKVLRPIHIPMLEEDNVRTGFLDDEGYLRLRQELPAHLRPIFVIAYHVGNRLGELRALRWDQVDFANDQILLKPGTTKNKRGRTLPIYGEMRAWLSMAKAEQESPWVFQHEGKPLGDFRKAWASACKRANVPGLLFHDLRRSAIRNMRLAGIPENVAMQISGHRTREVFERYNIVGAKDLKDAAEKLDRRMKESLGTISGTVSPEAQEEVRECSRKLLN